VYEAFVPRLEQLRLQALEDRIEADLQLGEHDRLVSELQALTTGHPLRERFHAQLMTALARTGRRAEALTAYQDARRVLVGELGIEPGPELRELQARVLAADGEPAAPRAGPPRPAPASVPRQLPAAVRQCTGRTSPPTGTPTGSCM
jgi:DNA-binding SARP family transcriptional activator